MKEKAVEYLNKTIDIFEKNVGTEHPLYSASLNNMAIYYYNERELNKAIEFLRELLKFLKTMGVDSDNYKNILSNIEFIKEEVGKSSNSDTSQSVKTNKENEVIENSRKENLKILKDWNFLKDIFMI